MKIYEIGIPNHYDDTNPESCDCTMWIASEYPIQLTESGKDYGIYIKEINVNPNSFGIDFIIK